MKIPGIGRYPMGPTKIITGAIGKQRFFIKTVEDGSWKVRSNDILLIQDEGAGPDYKAEDSNDFRDPVPHFFICKYQLENEELDSVYRLLTRRN